MIKAWRPQNGETIEDAFEWDLLPFHDVEDAAIEYAKDCCKYDSAIYDTFASGEDVTVRDEDGRDHVFVVRVEFEPVFFVTRKSDA